MKNWDKEFLEKLISLGIDPALYERFKDEITVIIKCLEAETKYQNGELVVDIEKKVIDKEKSYEEIRL